MDLNDPEKLRYLKQVATEIGERLKTKVIYSGEAINMVCHHQREPYDYIRGSFPMKDPPRPFEGRCPLPARIMLCVRKPYLLKDRSIQFSGYIA